ncbi:MAG: hypothetical protein DMG71_05975 [Acidobacteria bacterium]|nr:MAG: hypothetical protein DMG71_05975 [Acidobacteriota bacterium]
MLIGRAPSAPPSVSPSTATARGISRSNIHKFFSLFDSAVFNFEGSVLCCLYWAVLRGCATPHKSLRENPMRLEKNSLVNDLYPLWRLELWGAEGQHRSVAARERNDVNRESPLCASPK